MLKIGRIRKARLTRRHYVRFWGQRRMCHPVFIEKALGDGNKLLAVTPLNTRPNYYLIRVDSSWNENNCAQEHPMCDHIDEILEAIEEEVGPCEFEGDNGEIIREGWPYLDDEVGVAWCDSMDLIERHRPNG